MHAQAAMDVSKGIGTPSHCRHCFQIHVGALNGIDLCLERHASPCDPIQLVFICLLLPKSRLRRCDCRQTDSDAIILSLPHCLHNSPLLFVVTLAFAFFISSSIFLFKCSSFLSSMISCCRSPTIASRAAFGFSRLPTSHDVQADIVCEMCGVRQVRGLWWRCEVMENAWLAYRTSTGIRPVMDAIALIQRVAIPTLSATAVIPIPPTLTEEVVSLFPVCARQLKRTLRNRSGGGSVGAGVR